jgi:hypothetical protein
MDVQRIVIFPAQGRVRALKTEINQGAALDASTFVSRSDVDFAAARNMGIYMDAIESCEVFTRPVAGRCDAGALSGKAASRPSWSAAAHRQRPDKNSCSR